MRDTAGSAAAPAARCKNCLRWGSFIFEPPFKSFDHLVGELLEMQWHVEAERLGGLEIDHQLELAGLEDGQMRGLHTLKNLPGIKAGLAPGFRPAAAVAHQSAGGDEFGPFVDRRDRVARGQCYKPLAHDLEEDAGAIHDCIDLACSHGGE